MGDEEARREGCAVLRLCHQSVLPFEGDHLGGIIMNTAFARRLALGDRVIWMGKDDCQPSGPGTIIRVTAHQVEVLWEDETARRYRRAQLHNLRHAKLICELHGEWSAMFIDGVRESMAGAELLQDLR